MLLPAVSFIADGFEQLRVSRQLCADWNCPSLGVSLGILECHGDFQVAEIRASVALRDAQRFCMGIAALESCPVVVSVALLNQCVSVPVPYRVSHPARVGFGLQVAAVRVNPTVSEIFVQDDDRRGGLEKPLHTSGGDVARTRGQTLVMLVVLAEVFPALLNQHLRPRLNIGGLEVAEIGDPDIGNHVP